MSLILDALRKMEQDRKSREAAAQEMRSQVLRYRAAAAQQRRAKPYLLLSIGAVFVLGGVAAGIVMKGNRQASLAETPANTAPAAKAPVATEAAAVPAISPSATPAPAVAAAPAAPVASTAASMVAPAVAPPAQPSKKVQAYAPVSHPAPPIAAAVAPDAAVAPAAAQTPLKSGKRTAKNRTAAAMVQPAQSRNNEVVQGGVTDITVSGIAWQDERSLRRAVLNGNLVGEGAEVAGAKVVEIRENRVRLSRGGQLFDVTLTSGFNR